MTIANPKKILIAPLDWGLGHTTRCIPLIRYLQAGGHNVVFAGNNTQLSYIQNTDPQVDTIALEGYNVHYSKNRRTFMLSMMQQVPAILKTIRKEHDWLKQMHIEHRFDGIISDNRYGLYHHQVPSVIMTHQLQVSTGMGKAGDRIFRTMHYRMLQRFKDCWVVDVPGEPNLGGMLSHPGRVPANSRYIGLLSQLQPAAITTQPVAPHLLILLSGPEPQRTILSQLLWTEAMTYQGKIVFVEGSDDGPHPSYIPAHIGYYRCVTRAALQPLLANAGMIICRSGYSTLMDVTRMGKKAILIPTPGQTEQEYLGKYLHNAGIHYTVAQEDFRLKSVLAAAADFPYRAAALSSGYDLYREMLDNWIAQL